MSVQPDRLIGRVGIGYHPQGFEACYNLSVTTATGLSFNVQVVDFPLPNADSAVILGLRLVLKF